MLFSWCSSPTWKADRADFQSVQIPASAPVGFAFAATALSGETAFHGTSPGPSRLPFRIDLQCRPKPLLDLVEGPTPIPGLGTTAIDRDPQDRAEPSHQPFPYLVVYAIENG